MTLTDRENALLRVLVWLFHIGLGVAFSCNAVP